MAIDQKDDRPILALTMGDAAGSGAEIITMSLGDRENTGRCRAIVVGDAGTMEEALEITGTPGSIRAIANPEEAKFQAGTIEVLDLRNIDLANLNRGHVSEMTGQAAYEYIEKATQLALTGVVDGIVTSAINKKSLNRAGHHYDGHTGLLSALCGSPEVTMMLVAGKLRVSHVSTHLPLRDAIERIRKDRILKTVELTHDGLGQLGITDPHIAVAGLNPHAGENGLFGDEETRIIQPALEDARKSGYNVSGPYPGDTVFFRNLQGEFDGSIAMYHDQGHVAAKMLGIWMGVNVTLGLPIVRTSVEHGTNFPMAGKGTSDPRSMNAAIRLGASMAQNIKSKIGPNHESANPAEIFDALR